MVCNILSIDELAISFPDESFDSIAVVGIANSLYLNDVGVRSTISWNLQIPFFVKAIITSNYFTDSPAVKSLSYFLTNLYKSAI